MNRLTLLTTKECHLCGRARADLDAVTAATGVAWSEIDVAADPELAREYGDRLPVVLLDGAEHGYWEVDVDRLKRDLANLRLRRRRRGCQFTAPRASPRVPIHGSAGVAEGANSRPPRRRVTRRRIRISHASRPYRGKLVPTATRRAVSRLRCSRARAR
nr:glutaredoxin family protein [Glycomyces salinus]